MSKKEIILTGDRATGQLHLGHLAGSVLKRVELQETHDQTILVADMQGLTDNGHDPKKVSENILNVVADYLSVGIEPTKTTICLQSKLPALAELTMFYSNIVTVSRLERNPTVRNEIKNKGFDKVIPAGFLNYPISQAADITAFNATLIPVGDDQLPMIEQTNEIVRKMNSIVGKPVLSECRSLLSDMPRLPSLDGKTKMSKSAGNTITLDVSNKELKKLVNKMYTDDNHLTIDMPGQIEGNVVFSYLDAFYKDKAHLAELKAHYQRGGLGDGQTKKVLLECLIELITPFRERRQELMSDKGELIRVLKEGTEKSQIITGETCEKIKQGLGLSLF
jgi:tryptophanyl-tRNA synthetase